MAYRRKAMTRSATFVEDHRKFRDEQDSSTSSLAAQAIRASALHRDSSLSSAYGDSAFNASSDRRINLSKEQETNKSEDTSNDWTLIDPVKGTKAFKYQPMQSLNNNNNNTNNNTINNNNINNNDNNDINNNNHDAKNGFWGVVARKAKSVLDENGADKNSQTIESTDKNQPNQSRWSYERLKKQENPTFQKGSDALKDIGGKIRKSLEEGLTMVENRTADIIQETKKLQIMRKNSQNNDSLLINQIQIELNQSEIENQLKSSRDLANAMAAKAKLLLRELKTVKADLAFAELRCSQLEEENKVLRDGRQKGATNEDDDLIRLQLETLLAEKSRLAHENSVYARENRFLREIVDFHQFNTHDVVSLEDEFEEDNDDFALDIRLQEQHLEREERETEGEKNLEREEMQLQNQVLEREVSTMESSVLERETESTNAEKEERERNGGSSFE